MEGSCKQDSDQKSLTYSISGGDYKRMCWDVFLFPPQEKYPITPKKVINGLQIG